MSQSSLLNSEKNSQSSLLNSKKSSTSSSTTKPKLIITPNTRFFINPNFREKDSYEGITIIDENEENKLQIIESLKDVIQKLLDFKGLTSGINAILYDFNQKIKHYGLNKTVVGIIMKKKLKKIGLNEELVFDTELDKSKLLSVFQKILKNISNNNYTEDYFEMIN
jgi:hypothetical protein